MSLRLLIALEWDTKSFANHKVISRLVVLNQTHIATHARNGSAKGAKALDVGSAGQWYGCKVFSAIAPEDSKSISVTITAAATATATSTATPTAGTSKYALAPYPPGSLLRCCRSHCHLPPLPTSRSYHGRPVTRLGTGRPRTPLFGRKCTRSHEEAQRGLWI